MKFFHRYIEYLKHERKEIQKVHAVFFAAVLTAFFTGVYLYILYDIAPPKPNINLNTNKVYVRDPDADYLNNNYSDTGNIYTELNKENTGTKIGDVVTRLAEVFEGLQYQVSELKNILNSNKTYTATQDNQPTNGN
jgi:hypothetical protein